MSLLRVDDLRIAFGDRVVVDGVSFSLDAGQTLALVGESGSGKSLTALAVPCLLPDGAACTGRVTLDGHDMLTASPSHLRQLRGGIVGMVFQEPMTSLNPLHRIGSQVIEAIRLHQKLGRSAARRRAVSVLQECGFSNAASRISAFPHQLSGGQRQRVMIAIAMQL